MKIKSKDNFIVLNFGSYKSLLPELSTKRWWNNEDLNISITDAVAGRAGRGITDESDWYGFVCNDDDDFFFGVEYDIWDKEQAPLVIGVDKESIEENKLRTKFNIIGEDVIDIFITRIAEMEQLIRSKCLIS